MSNGVENESLVRSTETIEEVQNDFLGEPPMTAEAFRF
jgi:hypothetical protein